MGQVTIQKSQGSPKVMKKKEKTDRYSTLEKRLREIEGSKTYTFINPAELCLVLGVTVLKKFKILELKKYNGTMNPKTHIITYCKK